MFCLRHTSKIAQQGVRGLSTVPVGQVATHFKINVKDEPTAIKFDTFVKEVALPVVSSQKGYQKCVRTVCKGEWAYELYFTFDNAENYGAWKESKTREELVAKLPAFLEENKLEGLYAGVRVYDEM